VAGVDEQIVLDHGADASRRSSDGRTTPLHIAAERGFASVVGELLDAGADVDGLCARASTTDVSGAAVTPLMVAVNHGRVDCVAELLQAGADQNVHGGRSPAHVAVMNDDVACLRLLLERSPGPVDVVTDLLRLSIVGGAGCDVVEALVKSGRCDVDGHVGGGGGSSCRPLMLAALKGRSDVVDVLLDCHAAVDAALTDEHDDGRPLTALNLAVSAAVDPHCRADYWRRYAATLAFTLSHSRQPSAGRPVGRPAALI